MHEQQRQRAQEDHRRHALHTYLHDHTAGAEHAVELLKALRDQNPGTALGQFAADQLQQVQADLGLLEDLARKVGPDRLEVKEMAGWLADKLSRLKLAHKGNPFSTFETLEFLSLGILGKRGLWRALMSVSSAHPALQQTDFAALIERAEAQYTATETLRLQLAKQAFE